MADGIGVANGIGVAAGIGVVDGIGVNLLQSPCWAGLRFLVERDL